MIRALLLFLLFLPFVAYAQSATDIQAQIDAHNEQIRALQAEIVEYQRQVDELAKQKNTLQSAINSLTLSQKQLAAEISVTQNKIYSANLELRRLGIAIGDKEVTIETDQAAIAKALRAVAQGEQEPLVAQVFTARSLSDAWQAAETMNQFNRALADHIVELKATREALAINRDEVAAAKTKLESLERNLTLQKKSVDLNKAAQQKLLADTQNQESAYQKLLDEKRAEEAAFEAALFELASELEYVLDPSKIPPAGKGVLRSPLDSIFITQQFGTTLSSKRLYTSGTHDGVDFRASIGTPVRAALSGTVLEINLGSVQNCQYGKWVLIKHNNGLATLYAHLSDISITKNDFAVTGQVIGFSGNTGYATGPHLHFGVYFADAVSFKLYTCKNGHAVTIPIAPVNAYLNPLSYL